MTGRKWVRWLGGCGLALLGHAAAFAQPVFSIDFQGPPIGAPDTTFGVPITEGDLLLAPFGVPMPGPLPVPSLLISGGFGPPAPGLGLFLHPPAIGHPPGFPGRVELDAVSFGRDYLIGSASSSAHIGWFFSVDEFAAGLPGPAPSVFSEGILGASEASADIFRDRGVGAGPRCGGGPGNRDVVDGDGVAPFGGPGLGLPEPNPPTFGGVPDPGANLDALEYDMRSPTTAVFFSLDSRFPDPYEVFPPVNSASAAGHGFVGGDILVTLAPGGPPMLYAPAILLGLDLFGPDTDDLDALVLYENGSGAFERPTGPFSWVGGATDMVFFSVRRGSALVLAGVPDSRCGLPIEEGDILMPGPAVGAPPSIWIAAEALGLRTRRSGTAVLNFGDELDALDVTCSILGDLDNDSDVDLTDLSILLANFGAGPGGDVDGDMDTDLADLSIALSNFGMSC